MAKRKRGGGSLHLRKDGRWEGRVVIGYDEKGLPVTKNVLARTKNECAAKLAQLREMHQRQSDLVFGPRQNIHHQEVAMQIRFGTHPALGQLGNLDI